jgi:uncharacterized protein (TIGR03663 family)
MNRWSALAFLGALLAALALRLPSLDSRPLHNDEAVNATKLAALIERGEYTYDPHEYHGPALFYCSAAIVRLLGFTSNAQLTDSVLRITPVLFGVGLILLLLLLRDALGDTTTACAALIAAVSPVMVFYSRYFIHEMALAFFTLATIAAGWRWWKTRKTFWAVCCGMALGWTWATKETFVFPIVAAGFAGGVLGWMERKHSLQFSVRLPVKFQLGFALLAAFVVGGILFTSFFANPRGLLDSVLTYIPWISRAGGNSPHIQPWYFYFERLFWFQGKRSPVWTEAGVALLALLGIISAFGGNRAAMPSPGFVRFIAGYTVTLTAIYTLIPYKTPWCVLGFWSGVLILAGAGGALLWRATTAGRVIAGFILGSLLAHLGWQSWLGAHEFASDRRNPGVYAQTLPDAIDLSERVLELARLHPDGKAMPVKIICTASEWPLPWYLRSLKKTGWWTEPPKDIVAPVVIATTDIGLALDEVSGEKMLMARLYEFRPGVFLELYVEMGLWKKYVESRTPAASLAQ